MPYITGFLTPVKSENKDRYIASAHASWPLFQKYGALEQVETWGSDVPDGKLTSFPMAVKLEPGEVVALSWIRWPDKAAADTCFANMQSDPAFADLDMPFDTQRMIWGGFETIFRS